MLTTEGCRARRHALREHLAASGFDPEVVLIADPIHLRYFAGFYVDPFSLGADFGGLLAIRRDGSATLIHDSRLPASVKSAHADEVRVLEWYDRTHSPPIARQGAILPAVAEFGGRIHDALDSETFYLVLSVASDMRRSKHADEIETLRSCMAAGDVGMAWGKTHAKAGMSELDVYNGIFSAVSLHLGYPAIVYGDFAVSPGPKRRGGPPTSQILKNGDTLILDFAVVVQGYRSDFTDTVVVGGAPTADQRKIYEACQSALAAGEALLKPGVSGRAVYGAVRGSLAGRGLAEHFPHHAGHGLGLSHPEAPFFVAESTDELREGDVVTLEPGLYIEGVGGVRVEHNYLIAAHGCERLSNHPLGLG